jgi:hypothetical protein
MLYCNLEWASYSGLLSSLDLSLPVPLAPCSILRIYEESSICDILCVGTVSVKG